MFFLLELSLLSPDLGDLLSKLPINFISRLQREKARGALRATLRRGPKETAKKKTCHFGPDCEDLDFLADPRRCTFLIAHIKHN